MYSIVKRDLPVLINNDYTSIGKAIIYVDDVKPSVQIQIQVDGDYALPLVDFLKEDVVAVAFVYRTKVSGDG